MSAMTARPVIRRCHLFVLQRCAVLVWAIVLITASCQSNAGGGIPQVERLHHLGVLEREARLSEHPNGGVFLASSRRIHCNDMDESNRRLVVSRNYLFAGPRATVLDFHGSHLQEAGWALTESPDLGMEFTTAVYEKSFEGWHGRVIIVFNGQRIGVLGEDTSSPVC